MPWNDLIPSAGNDQTLARARKGLGRKTIYKLGRGGMSPNKELDRICDCSGFVAWAIGIPRQIPPGNGGWLDTDAYARGGAPAFSGLTSRVETGIRAGDIYVYPDYTDAAGKHEGHMGIISRVDASGTPTRVIHCSYSNGKAGDAVQETAPKAWIGNSRAKVVRVDYAALQARYAPGHTPAPPAPLAVAAAPLKHSKLANDGVLQRIAAGDGHYLHATSGRVDGVGALQDALNHLGAKYSECRVELGVDNRFRGFFGPKTEQAVERFQVSHGLKPDGLVGRDTLRALDAALASFDRNGGTDRTRTAPKAAAPVVEGDVRRAFIQLLAPAAKAAAEATKVPASITLAQGALESNWGRSLLSVQAKNFFGIKGKGPAGSVTMPTTEWLGGKVVKVNAAFRVYSSLEESCEDHARHIATAKWKNGIPIYAEAMEHVDEPRKFAAALEGVYATDPDYAEKLWRIMDDYQLQQYDV